MKDSYKAKFAAKWSEGVASRGFAPIPKCLITCMGDLGLKPQEAAVLFNIIERCWKAGDKAWPSVDYLATNVGRKNSATRDVTRSLVKKGFIDKEQRWNTSNLYGLEPLAKKLDEHMKHCRHTARKSEGYRRKSDSRDSQKSSDYLELALNRSNDLDSFFSQHFINEGTDQSDYGDNTANSNLGETHKHNWREFEVEKYKGEEPFTRYYFTCRDCGKQYHKDGEKPWPAEYPLLNS
jgi:hypothetical protein